MDVEAVVAIGLAIVRRIAKTGRSAFVIEAEERIGAHNSSGNS